MKDRTYSRIYGTDSCRSAFQENHVPDLHSENRPGHRHIRKNALCDGEMQFFGIDLCLTFYMRIDSDDEGEWTELPPLPGVSAPQSAP